MKNRIVTTCSALFCGVLSTTVDAAEPGGDASAGTAVGAAVPEPEPEPEPEPKRKRMRDDRADRKWIKRWAPERNTSEVGAFGGVLLPARRLELFEPDTSQSDQGFEQLRRVAPSMGLRLGYLPIRFLGVEGEAGVMPTRTTPDGVRATLWSTRIHAMGQLGLWSVTPFVLVGVGAFGVASSRDAVGSDTDAAFHFGGGVKFYLSRYTLLRLDVRDSVSPGRGVNAGAVHSPEVLLGLSVVLGRKRVPPPPPDTDGDTILDADDRCVETPGVREYEGCPIPDTDGDGVLDPGDGCVKTPGVPEYKGCPIPDSDGDEILDPDDECVYVAGVKEYKGCPIPDTDGDGFLDPNDGCVDVPESRNGYKDEDGCCDVVPPEVRAFTGIIRGIYFDNDKAVVKKKSGKVLREALKVFREFPAFKVEIVGHTDDRGSREHNVDLSERRATAVKQWLVDRDIDAARLITRGAGPDEPLESNATKKGRAKNRRIEFKLIGVDSAVGSDEPESCEELIVIDGG
jgi:outer membrane protein OmpA-like peptidoglycan-associated protein